MSAKRVPELTDLSVVGIDIGKDVFHLVGFDDFGDRVLRVKIKRLALTQVFDQMPRCIVGMEACLSANFVSRTLRRLGFEPRIIPAIYVKPFSKGQKNDYNDAEAIAEAALRPNLKAVAEKSQDQLDLQALHRVPPHWHDQPDPRFPDRTGHRGAFGSARVEELASDNPRHA